MNSGKLQNLQCEEKWGGDYDKVYSQTKWLNRKWYDILCQL